MYLVARWDLAVIRDENYRSSRTARGADHEERLSGPNRPPTTRRAGGSGRELTLETNRLPIPEMRAHAK